MPTSILFTTLAVIDGKIYTFKLDGACTCFGNSLVCSGISSVLLGSSCVGVSSVGCSAFGSSTVVDCSGSSSASTYSANK